MRYFIAAVLLAALALPALAGMDYHKTAVTRWAGPGQPGTYQEYLAAHPPQPLAWSEIDRRYPTVAYLTGPVLIVVESNLQTPLSLEISRYMTDLTAAGWEPILLSWTGGTAAQLRNLLQQYQQSDSIVGALLVGDLPLAWYELYEDWDNDGQPDSPYMVQFPCDLYFMDLNGIWADNTGNGILDSSTGSWQPDIFVGRLLASTMPGNETELIRNYFNKNHAFRTGQLYLPGMGLAYIDDDWAGGADQWAAALAMGVGLVNEVSQPDSTTADDYTARLDDGYYAFLLASHSSPQLHSMKQQGGTVWDNVYNTQITAADPHAFFYNLFCCSATRPTESNYIGGCYLFSNTWSVEVVGSAKTGSMLYFEDYYSWIQQGECQGEAFRRWFGMHGQEPGSVMWSMSWFYGMNELGDPTLFMKVGIQVSQVQVVDNGSQGSSGDGDGIPDAGETIALNLTLQNNDPITHNGLWVKLSSPGTGVDLVVDSVYVGTLPANGTAQANGFLAQLENSIPDSAVATVTVQVLDNAQHLWGDTFTLVVRNFKLVMTGYTLVQVSGDGDPWAEPGEVFNMTPTFANHGGNASLAGTFHANSGGTYIVLQDTTIAFPAIQPGGLGSPAAPVRITILPGSPNPYSEVLSSTLTLPGPVSVQQYQIFPVGSQLTWTDSFLMPDYPLVHYPVTVGYQDQWHISTTRYYSPAQSRKFGSSESGNYAPQSDGVLETPLFPLGTNTQLTFHHWIAAEPGYDGGVVEINTGSGWQRITPVGGYPGNSQGNGSYPGGPCYNGQTGSWSLATFNLAGTQGFARLRFRFASDVGTELEGWYVDDMQLTGNLVGQPQLNVTLVPLNPPITVPAAGGSFQFTATVQRTQAPQTSFYVWSRDRYPNGSYTGNLLGPVQINPPLGQQVTRLRVQNVPGTWPAGVHWYIGYANPTVAYPATDADSFSWTKLTTGADSPWISDAACTGESFPGEEIPPLSRGDRGDLVAISPNPFNPTTTIRYQLQAASQVKLTVWDTVGRLVATLVDGMQEAGQHSATFDGSKLASGLYFVRMQAGDNMSVQKIMLLK